MPAARFHSTSPTGLDTAPGSPWCGIQGSGIEEPQCEAAAKKTPASAGAAGEPWCKALKRKGRNQNHKTDAWANVAIRMLRSPPTHARTSKETGNSSDVDSAEEECCHMYTKPGN